MKTNPVLFAKAIADETRQKIMTACCCCELSVNEIVEKVGFSQPTISHHLAILRDAGLVSIREDGKQTFYSLNQDQVAYCCGQLMVKFAPEEKATQIVLKTLS
ncbi:MAG TPA: metalloregulator ArsR/SmtB family transcription factor [Anaerolineales bacterium]|jgi:DNA-binding transcriptional ArsR family regulator|nr:winged helix-turn-helix transcriptional regulator [Anaerolineales bacterium]HNQ93830.1 metalloregulator ArsR/SmtB family transcription factor [Anaerolineales bacterium]HNS60469.1 metalloregulator ArsR/SmtB family transcription factor [Anaerolineales bacterium]